MPWQVKQYYTAPTLIRSLMAAGDEYVTKHDRSSLRILGTVGEPINPVAWEWCAPLQRPSSPHIIQQLPGGLPSVASVLPSQGLLNPKGFRVE